MRMKLLVASTMALISAITYSIGYDNGYHIVDDELKEVRISNAELQRSLKTSTQQLDSTQGLLDAAQLDIKSLQEQVSTFSTLLNESVFKVGKFKVTAYSPYENKDGKQADSTPNVTATGTKPHPGTMAVDPKVIPYGSTVVVMYSDGTIEKGIAEDTGGAIKNNRIDVFRQDFNTAIKFGVKQAVVIWYKE